MHSRDWEIVGAGIALAGQPVDGRSAGVAEAEQPRSFVERLARGVVESCPQHAKAAGLGDVDQQRVTAAREQAEKGRLDRLRLEVERCNVTVQVIDRDQRQPVRPGDGLRSRETDEQRADEAWSLRDRDRIEGLELGVRLGQCLPQHGHDELEVASRSDLRDDAPEASVKLRLRGDDVREDSPIGRDDRGGRLVTRSFDAQDQSSGSLIGSFHMINASSRLSV